MKPCQGVQQGPEGRKITHVSPVPGEIGVEEIILHMSPGEEWLWTQKVIKKQTTMFIAALFSIAKIRKQPKFPTTDKWIKKMWYVYIMEYYSAMKRMKPCDGWT